MTDTPTTDNPDPLAAAERVLADLRARRDQAARRLPTLTAERRTLAFSAHVEGGAARGHLNKLTREAAEVAAEVETLDAAIEEAQRRLAIATAEAAKATRRANALAARERLLEFASAGAEFAEALATIRDTSGRLVALADQIRFMVPGALPRAQGVKVGLERAVTSAAIGGPLAGLLPPAQRIEAADLIAQWREGAEARLAAILGEATEPPPVDEPDPEPDEFEALAAVLGDGAEGETEEAA